MKTRKLFVLCLALALCLSMMGTASAAEVRKATDFHDFDRTAWYAEAVTEAVDNGLLVGKSDRVLDPDGYLTRAEMAAVINRAFGTYKTADIAKYRDVSKAKWYYKDVQMAVQMGTYQGRSASAMDPDSPITRQEIMTVVARAMQLDLDDYEETDLSKFRDDRDISDWALPYVKAMVGADYIHGRTNGLAPQDNITRAEFAQVFANIVSHYITKADTYKDAVKGNLLIREKDVVLQDCTIDGDLILGSGVADGKITLSNVRITGRLVVWGGGVKAVYCSNGTYVENLVVCRVDDPVKVIFDRDSTLRVHDKIDVKITDRAKAFEETEVIFYDISDLVAAQKELNAIVTANQIDVTVSDHLYGLVDSTAVEANLKNSSQTDTVKIQLVRKDTKEAVAEAVELAPGKTADAMTLLEELPFGNYDCLAVVTALRDGKVVGTLEVETTLHVSYLWSSSTTEVPA